MKNIIVEIRAGEGGDDSKDLVNIQYKIYHKYCSRLNLDIEILDIRPGIITFKVSGKNAYKSFINESGGIKWQRVPPTERRGRIHTSTITVAVLPEAKDYEIDIDMNDVEIKPTRGSGAGGQHRNKNDTAIQLWHRPSGIQIRCEGSKSQYKNKETAISILRSKLLEQKKRSQVKSRRDMRKSQVGSGTRGDENIIRTVRMQDDTVIDHNTDSKMSAKKYLKGNLELLY